MSCLAAIARASSGRLMILGTTRAARMPRMTTTTITSSKVKPRCIGKPPAPNYAVNAAKRLFASAHTAAAAPRLSISSLSQAVYV